MTQPAISIHRVSYNVGKKVILDAVDWKIEKGEHWAVLGPNGSGKTTLLKMACGYVWPNRGGTVLRKGKELVDLRELRKSMGWVTSSLAQEIPRREPCLRTVVSGKFAQIGLMELSGISPRRADYRRAEKYLAQMGAAHLRGQEFGTLSQGEQQKVLIARALMARPYVIFLDEPCAGLDPGARENFLASLQRLGAQEKVPALIYVTHHIEEILPMFKSTLILKEGRVLASGPTTRLLTPQMLCELYGSSFAIRRSRGRYWPVGR